MTLRCPKCAAESSDNAKFCKLCGTSLTATATMPIPTPVPLPELDPEATIRPSPAPTRSAAPPQLTDFDAAIRQLSAPIVPKTASPANPPTHAQSKSQKPTRYGLWSAIIAAGLVGAGAIYWYIGDGPRPGAVVATPAPSQPAAPVPTATPAPAAEPAAATLPEPAATPSAPLPEAAPLPVPAPAAIEAPPAKAPAIPRAGKPARSKIAPKTAPALPVPTPLPAPVIEAAPLTTAPTRPAPQPAVPSGPSSPEEACGRRIFLALAMCMQEQCATARFSKHPQCVEMRRQQQETQDRANRI